MPKQKRLSLKDRLWARVSDLLLDFAESLPTVKKGPLHFLQIARHESRLTKNSCPTGTELKFISLWMCEIIPIEQFEKQIPSIMRLLDDHKSRRFLSSGRSPKDILSTLRGFKETVLGTSWHNFHVLDCATYSQTLDIDYMSLEMGVFSGGHVAVYIRLVPTEGFCRKIETIVQTEYRSHTILMLPRNFRSLFRGWWGSIMTQGETKKRDDIQNTIVAFKESARKHLQQYFSGLLFKPGYMLPSIELWSKTEGEVLIKEDSSKPPYDRFWDSVGFPPRSSETYVDESDVFTLTLPERDIPDNSIKILCNQAKISVETGFGGSIPDQISYHVNSWTPTIISIWSLRSLYRDLVDTMSADRFKLFSKLRKLGVRRIFKWSKILSQREAQFKRLKKDLSLSDFPRDFSFRVPEFKRTFLKHTTTLASDLVGNTSYLMNKVSDLLTSTQQLLKTTLEALVISNNHFTQATNLVLGIIMLILTVTMVLTGVLAITAKPKVCEFSRVAPICQWVERIIER